MVTLPPHGPADGNAAHRHRELAESFGADAERYDRARPRYPTALVDAIVGRLLGHSILDVGIGTGISAEPFRDRGYVVLGVEPDARMAEFARGKGFQVEDGSFEQWDSRSRTFDGVIAGQTWHWVDPIAGASKAASVLRPAGCLALFWNFGRPARELSAAFAKVFASSDIGLPFNPWAAAPRTDPYQTIIDSAEAGLRATGVFTDFDRFSCDWRATMTRDAWLEQTSTSGGINRLPKEKLDNLMDGLRTAIDAVGADVVVDYTTVCAIAERMPAG